MPTLFSEAKRLSEVSRALAGAGLGYVAFHAGLRQDVPLWQRMVGAVQPPGADAPKRARQALEQLGGAYVKLGQLLSIRPDLLPHEFADEFKTLQDHVPPFDSIVARNIIENELGKPISSLFKTFDDVPFGSASIAQVHRAQLRDGTHVVVKVQRPDIEQNFLQDIAIMRRIATRLQEHDVLSRYTPLVIVDEFERYTRKELDFREEAQAGKRFEKMFARSKTIVVPHIHQVTRRVLVMTELQGTKLSDHLTWKGDRSRVVGILVDSMITQVFEEMFFHADLHPGNIMLLPGTRVGLLDFGITGSLTPRTRKRGLEMYAAIVANDSDAAARVLERVSLTTPVDLEGLQRDLHESFQHWTDDQGHLPTHMFHLMFQSARARGVSIPPELVLVGKALVTLEATCQSIDPTFHLLQYGTRKFDHIRDVELRKALSPGALRGKVRAANESLSAFSEDALAIMQRLKRGQVQVDIQHTDIRHLGQDINTSSNRLSYALVISALLVFSALVVRIEPYVSGISVYTLFGLFAAVIVLIMLLISILREGKKGVDPHP